MARALLALVLVCLLSTRCKETYAAATNEEDVLEPQEESQPAVDYRTGRPTSWFKFNRDLLTEATAGAQALQMQQWALPRGSCTVMRVTVPGNSALRVGNQPI